LVAEDTSNGTLVDCVMPACLIVLMLDMAICALSIIPVVIIPNSSVDELCALMLEICPLSLSQVMIAPESNVLNACAFACLGISSRGKQRPPYVLFYADSSSSPCLC
jgi:hypothetical protein